MQRVDLPEEFRFRIDTNFHIVDVRLADGGIERNLVCWHGEYLEGEAVGGWDGIREEELAFDTSDIAAVRKQNALDGFALYRELKRAFGWL